jgi:hypothetical protein
MWNETEDKGPMGESSWSKGVWWVDNSGYQAPAPSNSGSSYNNQTDNRWREQDRRLDYATGSGNPLNINSRAIAFYGLGLLLFVFLINTVFVFLAGILDGLFHSPALNQWFGLVYKVFVPMSSLVALLWLYALRHWRTGPGLLKVSFRAALGMGFVGLLALAGSFVYLVAIGVIGG